MITGRDIQRLPIQPETTLAPPDLQAGGLRMTVCFLVTRIGWMKNVGTGVTVMELVKEVPGIRAWIIPSRWERNRIGEIKGGLINPIPKNHGNGSKIQHIGPLARGRL